MISRKDSMPVEAREHMRGGDGTVHLTRVFPELPANARIFSVIELQPGESIGYHVHENETELFYFLQDTHCGAKDETHTVKEWLGEFDLADSEAWFFEWSDALGRLSVDIHTLEKLVPERVMQMVFNTVFNEIYLNYYGGMDFMQQFRTNTEKVEILLRGLKEKIRDMKGSDKA